MDANAELTKVSSEFWQWRMENWPEYSSFCGDHRYNDRLNNHTEEALLKRQEEARKLLERCASISLDALSDDNKVSLEVLTGELQDFIKGVDTKAYVFPFSFMNGILVDWGELTSWMVFNNVEDYKKYLQRLKCLPQRIEQDEAMLRLGISLGITYSKYCIDQVPSQLEKMDQIPVEESEFYSPFNRCPATLSSLITAEQEEAKKVVTDKILPAMKKLKRFIEEEYLGNCRTHPGMYGTPWGENFYKHVLQWHTSLPLTPQEVHEIGKTEVANIRAEMIKILEKVGFQGNLKEFLEDLRTNEAFYFKDKETMMAAYEDITFRQIRPTLSKLFHKIPDAPLSIGPQLGSKSGNAPYYLAGTSDGSRPGRIHVDSTHFQSNPKFAMMTLMLHEGEPGHHFQSMYSVLDTSVPHFRRFMEDMHYTLAPARFAIHTAYVEGWGLYCEYLGRELGLYEDPYLMFGYLSNEMLRACRLMVDTGLHAMGWTFEEAVKLFTENTSISKDCINSECKRYCAIPGQACAYKIGQMKIIELRSKSAKVLGSKFDVRDFHEEMLHAGMMPMTNMEDIIDAYIQRELAK